MILPILTGVYPIVTLCAISICLLIHMDPTADYPDHPQHMFKRFLMLANSVTFIYLLLWLAAMYIAVVISILL